MNAPTGWISFKDRTPTKEDSPIVGGGWRGNEWTMSGIFSWPSFICIDKDRTHWMSLPSPPLRGESQERKPAVDTNAEAMRFRIDALRAEAKKEKNERSN